jgi:hypothetical protein
LDSRKSISINDRTNFSRGDKRKTNDASHGCVCSD